jgi:hypothetical protein
MHVWIALSGLGASEGISFTLGVAQGWARSALQASRRQNPETGAVRQGPKYIEYEGKSHDVIDNKGRNLLSHDVYDK